MANRNRSISGVQALTLPADTVLVPMPKQEAEAWFKARNEGRYSVVVHARPRATDAEVLALLRRETDADNQAIVDIVRENGHGVSFGRVNKLRASLRRTRKAS